MQTKNYEKEYNILLTYSNTIEDLIGQALQGWEREARIKEALKEYEKQINSLQSPLKRIRKKIA